MTVGVHSRCEPGCGTPAEEPDRGGFSVRRGPRLPSRNAPTAAKANLASAPSLERSGGDPSDCRPVARAGNASQSSLLRFHAAQRPGRVPRVSVVLLYQRTTTALPELALSTGLQHGSAPLFLASEPRVAFSVDRLPSGHGTPVLQTRRSRRTRAPAGPVLGCICAGFFHVLNHSGILHHALLPRLCIAVGFRHGNGRRERLDALRDEAFGRSHRALCDSRNCHPSTSSRCPDT